MRSRRNEITKVILKGLFYGGAIVIASTSPTFFPRILPKLIKYARYRKKMKEIEKKKFYNAFNRLRNQGLIDMQYRGKQLYIRLTEEGRKNCGKFQIDDLKIKKPFHLDKKWRVLIFDISEKNKIKRAGIIPASKKRLGLSL